MSKKSLINIIMLSMTSLLLILTMFSWYVSNTEVRATGIIASTDGENYTLELERGIYDSTKVDTEDGPWTWEPTSSLSIKNMQPNDVFFFRFKITAHSTGNLNVTLTNIKSEIAENVLSLGNDDKSVLINGVKQYELDSNNKVVIENATTTLGTLYSYSNNTFSLEDYKIQNTFNYYDYGLGTANFYKSGTTTYYTTNVSERLEEDANAVQDLTNISTTYSITAAESYGYFALEFNDTKSLVTYKHLDGTIKTDSNLYQAQSLIISTIGVSEA